MLPKMKEVLEGLKVCDVIMEDTIVYDCTMEEHDRRLNFKKKKVRQSELKYLGHVVSVSGISSDPEKVRAIADMPLPTSVTELQTVCSTTSASSCPTWQQCSSL